MSDTSDESRRPRKLDPVSAEVQFDRLAATAGQLLKAGSRILSQRPTERDLRQVVAKEMRRSFAELGPAYVKFGQLIASSPGMFPEDLSAEFRSLLDQVPPADPQTIRSMLTNELGASPENVFGSFDEVPFASASIAQVHRAALKDGTAVVVKIQRPAIRTRLAADLQILKQIARGLELTEMGRMSNIYEVMRDFESNLAEELDFSLEARAMRDWTAGLAGSRYASKVRVPEIYSDLCTDKVLTMEYVEGIRIDDADAIRAAGFDGPEVVKTLMLTLFDSAFTAGTFHGDLHAGNLMVDPHGRIVFLDFGIVGRLDQRTRKTLRELIGALILEPDDEAAARTLIKLGAIDAHADPARVAESLRKVTRPMGTSLGKISYGTIGRQLTALGREHDAILPKEFILVGKQLLYVERYTKLLAPDWQPVGDPEILTYLGTLIAEYQQAREEIKHSKNDTDGLGE
ncbi:ABC1 kinase family protein [Mycobacteroides abscessus]|uniref:ABC1 kinase family protein n=1 Tax=Mycobacteroides abscessus TaxID=36809 RepID=UPI000D808044|nr:AarF/UbiB family protein [Mycobacteroides abscessus]SPX71353.1 putative unusual protein kinase [Mycobacteroides abscessus]